MIGARSSTEVLISLPDSLAVARIVAVPVVMALTRAGEIDHHLGLAAAVFAAAAVTDFMDGYLARRWKQETVLGAFLDTTADKVLVTGVLFALVSVDRVSIWAAFIIVLREFAVMALRGVVAIRGGLIRPSTWGKIKAAAQFLAIFLAFMRLPGRWGPLFLDQWAMAVAVIVTLASSWGYFSAFFNVVRRPEPA
jgi:CDP-diacylglycerol--glycerol-3-phosphate 3-phosphatidyltransferase